MGLDIGDLGKAEPEQVSTDLLSVAESAIRIALRGKRSSISFNTEASYVGRESELLDACASLKQKFPALVEIIPNRAEPGATVYLHKKPNPVTRFVRQYAPADM